MRKIYLSFFLFIQFAFELFSQNDQWVWMKGDEGISNTNYGVYGTQNIAAAGNRPGTRQNAVSWKDAAGNFWLFGGSGFAETQQGYLNDLWKYSPSTNQWTWVSGSKLTGQVGVYGTVTVPASSNRPGCRTGSVGWMDASGNLWMFGGRGLGNLSFEQWLNDLWKYDPATNQWTWMKGDQGDVSGNYGTINVAAASNKPGSRSYAVATKDNSGNFYLFGGYGNSEFSYGQLNDLWRYNIVTNQWTWIKGDKTANSLGVYGTQGTPAAANKPGGRNSSVMAADATYLWLFSGEGYPETGFYNRLNDLWRYNISTGQWTWMKGSKITTDPGLYGTITVPATVNKPGCRVSATGIMDGSGNFWVFGGYGYGETGTGNLNDVWRYNIAANQWAWMKGDKTPNGSTVFGNQGVAAAPNKPGARNGAHIWFESTGNLWLFSGSNNNELWKFNIASTNWIWVRDFSRVGSSVYGTIGIEGASNYPGNRENLSTWTDGSGNLWLFGGNGEGGTLQQGILNDLWKYNPATNQWMWMKGDSLADKTGIYGVINTPAATNKPGARYNAMTWTDNTGKLWLFGGYGYPSSTSSGYLNDLWSYDPSTSMWTWVHGNNAVNITGIYGTTGVAAAGNKPGSRSGGTSWTDNNGNLWLFGGAGYSESSGYGYLNDLWKFNVNTLQWTFVKGNRDIDNLGEYGVIGIPSPTNFPGSRYGSTGSVDPSGNFWLFGGSGYSESNSGRLNDLWKYETVTGNWTWANGSNSNNADPVYGYQGVPSSVANPGARQNMTSWFSNSGDFYMCGGEDNNYDLLNDLWKFNINSGKWTWLKGSSNPNTPGSYGTLTVPNPSNAPGARSGQGGWKTSDGKLWMFGGYGRGINANDYYFLNDLWNINPCSGNLSISPSTGGLCFGVNSIQLTVSSGGSAYEWYKDGVLIPSQTGVTYTATAGGSYYAKSVVGVCELFSPEVIITSASIEPSLGGNGIYCEDAGVNIGIPVVQDEQDYTWFRGGPGAPIEHYFPIGGSGNGGNQSLNFDMQEFRQGSYIVESTKPGCDTVYSNYVSVYYGGVTELETTLVCSDQVSFKWRDYGLPIYRFQYAVTQSSNPPANGNQVNSTSTTEGGLIPSTTYYIHVRGATIRDFVLSDLVFCNDWTTISFTTSPPLTSTISPTSGNLCSSSPIILTATATGITTFEWYRNGNIISGATSSTYSATVPGTYTVKANDGTCLGQISNEAILEGVAAPFLDGNGIYCGGTVYLTIPQTESGQSYSWLKNGIRVYGPILGNGSFITYQFVMTAGRKGTYVVESTRPGCDTVFSNSVYVGYAEINNLETTSICANQVTFKWDRVAPEYVSQYYDYEVTTSSTPTGNYQSDPDSIITFSSLTPSTTYYIHVRSRCGYYLSNYGIWTTISFVTPAAAPTPTLSPASASFCQGGSQLLTATGGDTYQWFLNSIEITGVNGNTYNATLPGSYTVFAYTSGCNQNSNGSNTAVITVTPNVNSTTNVSICTNQLPYFWNGNNYSTTGTYNVTLTSQSGCDSIATLNLTINPTVSSTTNASVCSNQLPYVWNGNNYSTTGTYNITLTSQAGCDSIATLNLTVNPTTTSTTNVSVCTNQLPYVWNGNNYSATGSYNVTLTNQSGCDSIATLNLVVNSPSTSTTAISICTNQLPYVWNGNNYNAAGSYNVTLTGSNGCDSIATLDLTVNAVLTSTTNASVCTNQLPYLWNGNNYNITGAYNVTLTSQSGCDSIATLNLTVNPTETSTTNVSTCTNQLPYVWNGNNYNTTGTYNITLTSQTGCDSIATLNLTVNPTSTSTTNASVCTNQLPYVWNGNNYTTTGSYNITLTNQSGCDSIATLNLTVNSPSSSTTSISICTNQLPYVWNGNTYNAAGSYNVTLTGTNGCDSIATLDLTVNAVLTSTTNASICTSQLPYVWNGNNYNTTGTYNVTLTSQSGCDSIATLNLTVNPVLTSTTTVSICTDQLPYVWNGNNYNTSGSYNVTLTGSNGCDSIANLDLTVNPVLTSFTNASVCTNQLPYTWNGNTYNNSGSYNITLTGSNGCDSIATLNLTVNPITTSSTSINICTNQLPYLWNGNSYTSAGTYTVTLMGTNGCDSIATLILATNGVLTSTTDMSVCSNLLPFIWNGNNYSTSGSYNVTLTGSNGCDSIATLNLTVLQIATSTTTVSVCADQLPYVWNGNNYNASGSYNITFTGSNGCDSIATLDLTVNPVLTSTTNSVTCNNQLPYVWNGNNYNAAGSYNITLMGSNGCDSIATLNLTVNPVLISTTNISICNNQLPYLWNGNSYNTAGSYNITLSGSNGCDSIATLNLEIKTISVSSTNTTICANLLPFIWNGNSYNTAGSYNVILTGANGCDSIATLVLSVNALPAGAITPGNTTICKGASQLFTVSGGVSYQWYLNGNIINGATLSTFNANTQGIYTVEITGANGCKAMSSNTSSLTVLQKPIANFDFNSTCQNEATIFNNNSQSGSSGAMQWKWDFGDGSTSASQTPSHIYTTPGTYTVTLIATPTQCPLLADTIKKDLVITPQIFGERYPIVRVLKNKATELSARNIGQQYLWQPATYLNDASIQKPMITTATDQLYLILITTANGCSVTDTVQVQAFEKVEVFVPKAFTPNGNNANDRLRPLVVGIVSIEYFRIYNRWGQLVFETKTIGDGWDGIYKNAPQVTDTYTWIFAGKDIDGNIIKSNGKSVLIR